MEPMYNNNLAEKPPTLGGYACGTESVVYQFTPLGVTSTLKGSDFFGQGIIAGATDYLNDHNYEGATRFLIDNKDSLLEPIPRSQQAALARRGRDILESGTLGEWGENLFSEVGGVRSAETGEVIGTNDTYAVQKGYQRGGNVLQRAFTLIELLVVISIISLLVGISLPMLSGARKAAQETVTAAQLTSTMNVAMDNYHGLYDHYPDIWQDGGYRTDLSQLDVQGTALAEVMRDPFRVGEPVGDDELLNNLGLWVNDSDYPTPEGETFTYWNFESGAYDGSSPVIPTVENWNFGLPELNLPTEPGRRPQFMFWGTGKDGVLDGDPAKDMIFIKPSNLEQIIRHQP